MTTSASAAVEPRTPAEIARMRLDAAAYHLCISTTIDPDERHTILTDLTAAALALRDQQRLDQLAAAVLHPNLDPDATPEGR
jgi:hypothetical protein